MASGTIPLTVNSSGYYSQLTGYISWEETSVNQDENKSTVAVKMTFVRPSDGAGQSGWGESHLWIKIDGTRYEYLDAYYIESGETGVVGTTATGGSYGTTGWNPSKTITHTANGSKSITIEAGGYVGDYAGRVVAIQGSSGSGTAVLTDIPRASTIGTITGNVTGSQVRVNIIRSANSAFYHKLSWSFVSASGNVNSASSTATYINWTPTSSTIAAQIPNATSGTCTLTLTTYSNSSLTTQVGTPDTATFTLYLADSIVPSCTAIATAETVSANNTGQFIQSVTKPKFTATASGVNGSTITNYSFTFGNATKSGSATNQTFGAISGSGSLPVSCTVTDSRGRTGTYSTNITVLAYTKPKITSASVRRSTSDATAVTCTVSCSVSSIKPSSSELNTMTVYALYTTTSGTYPNPTNTYKVTTSGVSASGETKDYTLSATTSYKFKITVQDKFNITSQEFKLGTAAVILDITQAGQLGVGKYRERGGLDVKGETYLTESLYAGYNVYTGGKASASDGLIGASITRYGNLTLTGDSSNHPGISFYGTNGTTQTARISEEVDGRITHNAETSIFAQKAVTNETSTNKVIFVPYFTPSYVGWSGATGFPDGYLSAWIAKVCSDYPSCENVVFIGSAISGSRAIIMWFCYSTSTLSSGLPQSSTGLLIPYSSSTNLKRFGTASYTFWSAEVGGGGTSYTNADDVLF